MIYIKQIYKSQEIHRIKLEKKHFHHLSTIKKKKIRNFANLFFFALGKPFVYCTTATNTCKFTSNEYGFLNSRALKYQK